MSDSVRELKTRVASRLDTDPAKSPLWNSIAGICATASAQTRSASPTPDSAAGDATITTGMTSPAPTRVLVVAHQTAATPRLLDEVRARARRSPCAFTLVVPRPYWDPETDAAAATLELAIPLLHEAAGGHVKGIVGDSDPFVAVQQAVERGGFDEIIISTLPARVSRWLRRDLPHRVEALGLPVTVVTAQQSEPAVSDAR
jgi:hypothetical protein